jgi:CRP-like cAMP-binding protein
MHREGRPAVCAADARSLQRGALLVHAGACSAALEVLAGAVRMHEEGVHEEGAHENGNKARAPLLGLALPGDVIGVHRLLGEPHRYTAQALTGCVVRELPADAGAWSRRDLLARLVRQHDRCVDLALLRSGDVASRIRHLLRVLALAAGQQGQDPAECELPSLLDMAALIDAAPETVSRAIGGLRRALVLQPAGGRRVRFAVPATVPAETIHAA